MFCTELPMGLYLMIHKVFFWGGKSPGTPGSLNGTLKNVVMPTISRMFSQQLEEKAKQLEVYQTKSLYLLFHDCVANIHDQYRTKTS